MATIKSGILGAFSGKVGSVIGSTWKGIAVMKSRPSSVTNPRTALQTANRDKFKYMAAFWSSLNADVVKPLWDRFASRQSGYNAALQYNIAAFSDSGLLDPTLLYMSNGKMAATEIATATLVAAAHTAEIEWASDAGQGFKLASDQAFVVLVNVTQNGVSVAYTADQRSDLASAFVMPSDWVVDDEVYCYLSFRRTDGTVVSTSSYMFATIV